VPELSNTIFSQKALDKMYSADNLNKALRISNPRFWTILAACAVLLVGFIIWGFFGTVVSTVSVNGVVMDGQIHCFLTEQETSELEIGNQALANNRQTSVLSISKHPLSRTESEEILQSSYLAEMLQKEKWAYHVILDGDDLLPEDGHTVNVRIITKELAPVQLIMGGGD